MIGMGYFTSMDPSTWGVAEWGTVAGVVFVGSKVIASHPLVRSGRKRAGAAASKGASSLGNIALLGIGAYGLWWLYSQYQAGSLTLPGLGDYQQQGYVNPQILQNPTRTSAVQVPIGWAA